MLLELDKMHPISLFAPGKLSKCPVMNNNCRKDENGANNLGVEKGIIRDRRNLCRCMPIYNLK